MNEVVGWTLGLVAIPAAVAAGIAGIRLAVNKSSCAPGSAEARRVGCTCPRAANWFGTRGALSGELHLASDCPVLSHRRDRALDVHLRR